MGLHPEHRAFVVDTLFLQRYYLTDHRKQLPADMDPTAAGHFCLMDGWEKGFWAANPFWTPGVEKERRAPKCACQPVRNCVSQWMVDLGLGDSKEELIEEKIFLDLWRQGLPLEFGGMPLGLEAVYGEQGLPYVHRCALGFSEDAVDRFVLTMEFTVPEEEVFRRELARLRALAAQKEDKEEEVQDLKRKKKKKKKKKGDGRFLGEDPVVRRKAAEKIQAQHRGNYARREVEAKRRALKKQSPADKLKEERLQHEERLARNEAAAKIQAVERGRRQRRKDATVSKMMNFVFKMMRKFVSKTRNFVLKMMKFAGEGCYTGC